MGSRTLGQRRGSRVYVWPHVHFDELKELLDRGIELLANMLDPPGPEWDFLALWDHDVKVIAAIQRQLDELQARRAGMA